MNKWNLTVHHAGEVIGELSLPNGTFLIGTDPACGIFLQIAGVAPMHAEIQLGGEELLVEDLGSLGGTTVNGYAISGRVEVPFPARVQVGETVILLEAAAEPPSASQDLEHPSQDEQHPLEQGEPAGGRTETPAPPEAPLQGEMGNAPVHMEYALRREIARGGMGQIYEGTDPLLKRQVAVKVSSVSVGGEDLRFSKEAKILAHLAHPNVVPIYAIGVDELDRPFYSMKLVKGRTLQAVLNALSEGDAPTEKAYSRDRLLTVFRKILDAIAFAHSKQILHRDLKPENIMVGEYGEVLVMDWGLAKPLGEAETLPAVAAAQRPASDMGLTMEGEILGTPQYMSPEQAEGFAAELDFRSDIYALGGILYAILTLRPPVEGGDLEEILTKVKKGDITAMTTRRSRTGGPAALQQPPSAMEKGIPEALQAVTMKALAHEREHRYETVEALISDIEAYQHGFATSAENAGLLRKVLLAMKRHKTASLAALLIVSLTASFMGKIISSEKTAQQSIARLRETAPTFASNARALVENAAYEPTALQEALTNIAYAIELDPLTLEYRLLEGKILQTLQRLDSSRKIFSKLLEDHPDNTEAKTNLLLCDQFLPEQKGGERLSNPSLNKLAAALRAQNRQAEALFLTRDSSAATEGNLEALRAAMRKAGIQQPSQAITSDGQLRLILKSDKVDDLKFLRGIPLNDLVIENAPALKDLTSLGNPPLQSLFLDHQSNITDLSPLRDLPLKKLNISFRIKDLSGLEGLALEEFTQYSFGPHLVATQDFAPLAGMPLKSLDLGRGAHIPDLAVLAGPGLKKLRLFACSTGNLEALSASPLESLDISSLAQPVLKDLQFLKGQKNLTSLQAQGNKLLKDITALKGLPIRELRLADTLVSDLTPVAGMPLETLDMNRTPVTSLAPLKNLSSLVFLNLDTTLVTDLSPLAGSKLQTLILAHCEWLSSLAPLAQIPTLRTLALPIRARNMEPLRNLKNLAAITYDARYNGWGQLVGKNQSAREFWKMVDLEKQLRQAEPGGKLRPSKFPHMAERFPGAAPYNGHWYFYMPGRFSWLQAKAIAEELGGHLATITSPDEYNMTRGLLNKRLSEGEACWLGAQADKPRGTFRWVTGEPWAFTHWGRPTEPAQLDDFGNPATVLVFAEFPRLPATPNFCALSPENKAVAGFLVEWED